MSYKKVGGLHFVKLGRFGFSFYWSRAKRVVDTRPMPDWVIEQRLLPYFGD